MNEIALLEVDPIGRLIADLVGRPLRVPLSAPLRQAALTIATDEAYHAFVAREFVAQVEDVTGIAPFELRPRPGIGVAREAMRRAAGDALRDDMDVVVLCVAENTITAEIFGITEGTPPDNPFHIVSAEHLVDERRHSGYFQHQLSHYCANLDDATREGLAALLPRFITAYLEAIDWTVEIRTLLRGAGMDAETIEMLLQRFAGMSSSYSRAAHPMGQNIMRFLERAGVLSHPLVSNGLTGKGWLAVRGG